MSDKRKRIFNIIQIGNDEDFISRLFDYFIMLLILLNLFIALFETYDQSIPYQHMLSYVEGFTVIMFTLEYTLRVWTSDYLYPGKTRLQSVVRYILSPGGIVDLLSFLPFYLPVFFPAGIVAFRIFRIVRILRLFRINAYSDALSVILDVIRNKANQLLSSVFIILVLMVASSLCMYSLEHEAQPEIFKNAFSGFWWSVSTLLTVGYGDIYPVTTAGRICGIIIAFLGVGMVAIPTGIISAGFVEQYSLAKNMTAEKSSDPLCFFRSKVSSDHPWINHSVADAMIPSEMVIMALIRNKKILIPDSNTMIHEGDLLVIGSESYVTDDPYDLDPKQAGITPEHPWCNETISDIEYSGKYDILLVYRNNTVLTPEDNLRILPEDTIVFSIKKRSHKHKK